MDTGKRVQNILVSLRLSSLRSIHRKYHAYAYFIFRSPFYNVRICVSQQKQSINLSPIDHSVYSQPFRPPQPYSFHSIFPIIPTPNSSPCPPSHSTQPPLPFPHSPSSYSFLSPTSHAQAPHPLHPHSHYYRDSQHGVSQNPPQMLAITIPTK